MIEFITRQGVNMSKNISQKDADKLFAMEKFKTNDNQVFLPYCGDKTSVVLESKNKKEKFVLDINTSSLSLLKCTFQNRSRETLVLCRLDVSGPPHRNPDGEEIGTTHIHYYKEGFDNKWAYDIPVGIFSNINDRWQTLQDFMKHCNIVETPNFVKGLF